MRYRITVFFCFILAALQLGWSEGKKACTQQDARQAEVEASSLQDWEQVYKSYKRFGQCDDASIGEGYSDSVARLLSDHWETAGELLQLISHDKGFEQFVLRHIDELMSPMQAETIRRNALSHCSTTEKSLCRKIIFRIKEASSTP